MTFIWNVLDWSGADFLGFYVLMLVGAFALAVALRPLARSGGGVPDAAGLSAMQIAFIEGGPARASDTLVLELAARGDAEIGSGGIDIHADRPSGIATPGRYSREQFLRVFNASPTAIALENSLVGRHLILSRPQRIRAFCALALPMALLICLGLAKLVVGLARDKPVGFLLILLVLAVSSLFWLWFFDGRLTSQGKEALSALRARNDRLIRAPRHSEVALAFAFAGTAALAGSPYAAYAAMIPQPNSSGASGSGCSGGSGCGGGGGCGGCSS